MPRRIWTSCQELSWPSTNSAVLALPSPSAHRSPSYHVTNHTRALNMRVTACTSLHDLGHSGSIVVGIEMSANPGAQIDQQHPYETTELCTEKMSLAGTCCIRRPNRVEELCREHCVASTSAFPLLCQEWSYLGPLLRKRECSRLSLNLVLPKGIS